LVYDIPGGRDLRIDFKYSNYKYLKLKFSGSEGDLKVLGFKKEYKKNILIPAEKERKKVFADIKLNENKQSLIFDLKKDNLFYEKLELLFDDKKFKRKYILYASDSITAEIYNSNSRFDKNKQY
jgi:hypothetical protein